MELVKPVVLDIFEFEHRDKSISEAFPMAFSDYHDSGARRKISYFSFDFICTKLLFPIETLMEETQLIDTEIYDFENREINVKRSFKRVFELSGL